MIPEDRLQWMQKGSDHFLKWLDHVVTKGVSILEKDEQLLPHVAEQMTDAKLGGFANRLLNMRSNISNGQIDLVQMKAQLARMQLAALALQRWDQQEKMRQYDVAQYAGFHVKKEIVQQSKPLISEWWTVGRQKESHDRITTIKTWFYSLAEGFYVQIDHFFGSQKQEFLPVGNIYNGHLHRYPSSFPMRGIADQMRFVGKIRDITSWSGQYHNWSLLQKDFIHLTKQNPWRPEWPFLLAPSRIISRGKKTLVIDQKGMELPMECSVLSPAYFQGGSLDGNLKLWGLWQGKHFEVLGVYAYNHYLNT